MADTLTCSDLDSDFVGADKPRTLRTPKLPCGRLSCQDPNCDRWHEGDDDGE